MSRVPKQESQGKPEFACFVAYSAHSSVFSATPQDHHVAVVLSEDYNVTTMLRSRTPPSSLLLNGGMRKYRSSSKA